MKRICFAGDSLMMGEGGFSSILESKILLDYPQTQYQFHSIKTGCDSYASIINTSSGLIIGRGPSVIILSLGLQDIFSDLSIEEILQNLKNACVLLMDKTGAELFITNLPSALIKGSSSPYEKANHFNQKMPTILGDTNCNIINIDRAIVQFLELHIKSEGEKRALHKGGPKFLPLLLPLGSLLIASVIHTSLEEKLKL